MSKISITFLISLLFVAAWAAVPGGFMEQSRDPLTFLSGIVKDIETNDVVIGANVKVMKEGRLVKGAATDLDGKFRIAIDPGIYDVHVSFMGTKPVTVTGVQVLRNIENFMEPIVISSATLLSDVEIIAYKTPTIAKCKTSGGQTPNSDVIRSLPTRDVNHLSAPAAPATSEIEGEGITIRGSRTKATSYHIEGIRVMGNPGSPDETEKSSVSKLAEEAGSKLEEVEVVALGKSDKKAKKTPRKVSKKERALDIMVGADDAMTEPDAHARLLTAGEWNDLHNWKSHFAQIYKDGEVSHTSITFQIYPEHRYSVILQNKKGIPVPNATVHLRDERNEVIWTARTDHFGKAELWDHLFTAPAKLAGKPSERRHYTARVGKNDYDLGEALPFADQSQLKTVSVPCRTQNGLDIMWVVDATGSMADEINYLKAELTDVIGAVQKNLPKLQIRNGAVFYRDHGDEYLVRSSELSADLQKTRTFINAQSADGGGDTPEAVDEALEEAIMRMEWREDAIARICFVILDASPHHDPAINARLARTMKSAAAKGIRIVPVAASGVIKETEFLMKFLAICTNGTYVFLTDHSGIGEKHMEPTAETYKVELLNDLFVRLITEYSTQADCDGKTEMIVNDRTQQTNLEWSVYPNPATNAINLDLPEGVLQLKIFNSEGKLVRDLGKQKAGVLNHSIQDLAVGYYIVKIETATGFATSRLVVVRA